MKTIEDVTIPLIAMPPPLSHRLVRWLVRDGVHVSLGEAICELEIDGQRVEMENFSTGHIKQMLPEGTACAIGDRIAKVLCDETPKGSRTFPLHLSAADVSEIDARRGEIPRETFIRDTFLSALGSIS